MVMLIFWVPGLVFEFLKIGFKSNKSNENLGHKYNTVGIGR